MIYFLDTEFHEDGRTIDLISIGLVAADGREFYACNAEADWSRINQHEWLRENVIPHLPEDGDAAWMRRDKIRDRLLAFVSGEKEKPEFWAYFADYDWVALCQLFGRMIDLPKNFPFYCNDIKQLAVSMGVHNLGEVVGKPTDEHHALADARWNKRAYEYLVDRGGLRSPQDPK